MQSRVCSNRRITERDVRWRCARSIARFSSFGITKRWYNKIRNVAFTRRKPHTFRATGLRLENWYWKLSSSGEGKKGSHESNLFQAYFILQTYAMFESRFNFETIFPRIKFWKRSAMLQTHRLNKLLSDYIINVPCLYLWLVPSTKRVTRDSRAMELSRISPSSREQPRMARGTGVSSGDSWASFPF